MFVSALAATGLPAAGLGAFTWYPLISNKRSDRSSISHLDKLAIQFGIAACRAAPGDIGRHARVLQFSPRGLVLKGRMGAAHGACEILSRDRRELEPGCRAAFGCCIIGV